MALTKEDLLAIAALMDSKLEPIRDDIANLKAGQQTMQSDVDQIKENAAIARDVINGVSEWTEIASDVLKIRYPVKE